MGDVATVTDGFEERESIARYDGREAIGLVIFKESGANTVRVDEAVREIVAQLRAQFPDVELAVATSQARFISLAISNVVSALLQGAALAFLVLFLFLRDWRYPVAIGLAIPISVVATFSLLDAAGVSLNVMTLGGLALGVGMLVDNSIVVLENIFRHRELGLRAGAAAVAGAEEVQSAVTSSTLTTIAVFGPILYIEGIAGELFGALSLAVAFSLLASLVVALTLLPTMAARWGGPRAGAGAGAEAGSRWAPLAAFDRGFARFTRWYERALAWSLDHKGRVLGVAAAMFALSIAVGATLDRDVLPDVDQGEFTVRIELDRGTPLDVTARTAARLERVLLADVEVAALFTRIGRQAAIEGIQDEASGLHTAVIDVRLEDDAATEDAVARLRPALATLPASAVTIERGAATALGRLLGGGGADVAVRVAGEDLDAALEYAGGLAGRLSDVASLTNVRLGTELGQPEVRIAIDRERAASYGIDARRVAETITAYMQGEIATHYVDFDQRVPVVVRLPDETRHSLAALDLVRVDGVPLSQLIRLEERLGPTEIRRVDQARQVSVLADVRSGGLADAVADAEAVIAASPAPRDLRVEIGGENDEMRRGFRALAFAFLLSLLLVFMILAAEFESFAHPFVVLLTVPLAIVGASLALFIAGAGINVMSLIGLIILVGIVDNGAVVAIDYINQLRGRGLAVREAILQGGLARMRPILMTTATTLL
ncbi:MAG: efflux RND transporter permease subunit, partial [Longimicrobiales bacterium]